MERRGHAGPFRCPLCVANTETISHLFFNCPYTISIWNGIVQNEDAGFHWNGSNQEFFIHWEKMYKGELTKKKGLRACWQKLAKIVCWCVWKERNQRIFQNQHQPVWKLIVIINALLGEVVSRSTIPSNKADLTSKEKKWMQNFKIQVKNSIVVIKKEEWEIRMDKVQFENWLKERKIFKLFFDGASKGNPRRAGGGGFVINPRGKTEIEYSWSIRHESNNMVEAYGLWQGLKQVQKLGVEEVVIIGDSRLIIHALIKGRKGNNERLEGLLKRIRYMAKSIRKIEFFHVLRELNENADEAANKFIDLGCYELTVNSKISLETPP